MSGTSRPYAAVSENVFYAHHRDVTRGAHLRLVLSAFAVTPKDR